MFGTWIYGLRKCFIHCHRSRSVGRIPRFERFIPKQDKNSYPTPTETLSSTTARRSNQSTGTMVGTHFYQLGSLWFVFMVQRSNDLFCDWAAIALTIPKNNYSPKKHFFKQGQRSQRCSRSLKNSTSKKRLEVAFGVIERNMVDMKIMRGFCARSVLLNVLQNTQFIEMIQAIKKWKSKNCVAR